MSLENELVIIILGAIATTIASLFALFTKIAVGSYTRRIDNHETKLETFIDAANKSIQDNSKEIALLEAQVKAIWRTIEKPKRSSDGDN